MELLAYGICRLRNFYFIKINFPGAFCGMVDYDCACMYGFRKHFAEYKLEKKTGGDNYSTCVKKVNLMEPT